MLYCVSVLYSFLLSNDTPLYGNGHTTFCLSIHQLMDNQVFFNFAITNNAVMKIRVRDLAYICFGGMY